MWRGRRFPTSTPPSAHGVGLGGETAAPGRTYTLKVSVHSPASGMRILASVAGLGLLVALAAGPAQAQETPAPETYVVKPGDTLYSIARRFDTSVARLRDLNDLPDNTIRVGQELVVRPPGASTPSDPAPAADTADTANTAANRPPSPDSMPSTARPPAGARPPVFSDTDRVVPASETLIDAPIDRLAYGAYVIRPGDTFFSIAVRYGTTADSLFALNGAHTDPLPPGKVLRLPGRFALPSHVVQERDTSIYDVAARYGVSVRALRHANDLKETDRIETGQRLRVPGRSAPKPAARGTLPPVDARGPVEVFPETYAGRLTASGTRYDPEQLVVSHPELPFGSVVLLTNPEAERSTFAHVIDRGPIDEAMLVDVSTAVADRLGLTSESDQPVALRIVE